VERKACSLLDRQTSNHPQKQPLCVDDGLHVTKAFTVHDLISAMLFTVLLKQRLNAMPKPLPAAFQFFLVL
jgi:hypothetical protein